MCRYHYYCFYVVTTTITTTTITIITIIVIAIIVIAIIVQYLTSIIYSLTT